MHFGRAMSAKGLPLRVGSGVTAGAAVLALALVWWAEHVQGMVPCELCLMERWPWRAALLLGAVGVLSPWRRVTRVVVWLLLAVLAVGCALAVLHAGVEQGWWRSPMPECNAPKLSGKTFAERFASMPLRPAKPCDAPAYLVSWLPVSMTVMGGLAAAALMGLLAALLVRDADRAHGRGQTRN